LGLRRHPTAERLASGYEWKFWYKFERCSGCSADSCLRHRWWIGSSASTLHVWKLVAQRCDVSRGKPGRHGGHEGMIHTCSSAVRQQVTRSRSRWRAQQSGNADFVTYWDLDGDGFEIGHNRTYESNDVISIGIGRAANCYALPQDRSQLIAAGRQWFEKPERISSPSSRTYL
jgi:hypothetical protein